MVSLRKCKYKKKKIAGSRIWFSQYQDLFLAYGGSVTNQLHSNYAGQHIIGTIGGLFLKKKNIDMAVIPSPSVIIFFHLQQGEKKGPFALPGACYHVNIECGCVHSSYFCASTQILAITCRKQQMPWQSFMPSLLGTSVCFPCSLGFFCYICKGGGRVVSGDGRRGM